MIPVTRIQQKTMFLFIIENKYFSVSSGKRLVSLKARTRTDLNSWGTGEPLYAPGPAGTPPVPPLCNPYHPAASGDSSLDFLLAPGLWGNIVLNREGYKIIRQRHGLDLLNTLSQKGPRLRKKFETKTNKQDGKIVADLGFFRVFPSGFRSPEVI